MDERITNIIDGINGNLNVDGWSVDMVIICGNEYGGTIISTG
jgi:hypothetical protein